MKLPVFDLHCDTALALMGEHLDREGSLLKNEGHMDLTRAEEALGGYCQCFACFTTPSMADTYHVSPVVVFERELATIQRELDRNKKIMKLVYSPEEILSNQEKGLMSAVLTIEGPAGFGFDPELLPDLHAIGFRISTLGWNESNVLTGSHVTGEGLSDLGRTYVKTCQELGILVDVSHISDAGFWDIMKCTEGPVIATHSNSRAVCGHSRNLTDDMFRAIMETGGVAGLNQCADFIGENPTLDTVCDHVLHFLELDPEGKHIALGGDLDGVTAMSAGFDGIQSYPALFDRLLHRGVTEEMLLNICWNNAIGVMQCAVRNHKRS